MVVSSGSGGFSLLMDVCATVGGAVLGVLDVSGCKILGVVVSRGSGVF